MDDVVMPFDYNGDGKSDIFICRPDHDLVGIIRSNGDGSFTNVYQGTATGIAGYRLSSARDRGFTLDYNGDGMSDLFFYRADSGPASVMRSNGDGTFSSVYYSSYDFAGYPQTSLRDRAFPFDYNGNGRVDIFFYRLDTGLASVIQSGDKYPDIVDSIDNGVGGLTQIQYMPSSHYQNHLLPFIVHPVSSITVDDGIFEAEDATITYDYSGGLFDYETREFRGFQTVTQTHSNNTVQITNFYQGRDDSEALPGDNYFFKGRTAKVEFKETSGGSLLSETEFTWDTYPASPESWAFVKLAHKRSDSYNGVTTTTEEDYVYDNLNGNLESVTTSGTGAESITKTLDYDNYGSETEPIWRMTSEMIKGGASSDPVRQVWYDYDNAGNLILEEHWNNNPDDPTNPVTRREYYANGNLWKIHDPNGNPPTIYEYDAATETYPVKITNALGHTVEYEYDYRFGKVSAEKDANDNLTDYGFDPFGRLKNVKLPDDGETIVDYYDHVFPRYVRTRVKEDNSGSTIDVYEYIDGLGRSIQTISFGENGTPIVTQTRYDAMGRVDQTWGPFFSTFIGYHSADDIPGNIPNVKTDYDLRSRPTRLDAPLGEDVDSASSAVTTFSYSGLSITITDPDGGKKTEQKDYLGRIVQVTEYSDAGELYTGYHYNAAGDLLDVTDAMGNVTAMSYDSLGRKISMTDPDMGYWKYTYDANGNLITQTDAKGQTTTFDYDAINRIEKKRYSTADSTVTYTYDEASVQNGVGRLYRVENSHGSTEIDAYDSMGREVSVTQRITGAPRPTYTTGYAYDPAGRLESLIYPGGYQVNYGYHQSTTLLDTVNGITDFAEYAELSDYEPSGKIGDIYHGNGAASVYLYDAQSTRLLSMLTTDPSMADLQHNTYLYTAAGDIKSITKKRGSNSITYNYTYDKLHRLIGENNTAGADSFDPSMLIKTFDDTAPIHAVKSVNFNGMDYPYEYDQNGNMTLSWDFTDPSQPVERQIDLNADNMPVQIRHMRSSGTVKVDLSYDGAGVRVRKAVQGGSTTYYIGGHFEVADGVEIKYIFAGNLRIAKVTTAEKQFYHKDHLGSSTVITNYPDGSVIESAEYLPFGLFREHSETEVTYYKFSDQELDAEVGLYNFNARLYDPAIGVFISPDSIVQDPYDPQTLNRYTYCRNNPLIYNDPSGHFIVEALIGAAIGAIIGGTTAAVTDGDIGQGMLMGAIGGAFLGVAGGVIEGLEITSAAVQAGIHASAGATSGGINAFITGGDVGIGMLSGGIMGGFVGYFGTPNFTPFGESEAGVLGNRFFNNSLTGAGFGAAYAGMTGGDIAHGAAMGALGWAGGTWANMLIGHTIGFVGQGMSGAGWKQPAFNNGAYIYEGNRGALAIGNAIWGEEPMHPAFVTHEVAGHIEHQGTLIGPGYLLAHIIDKVTFTNLLEYSSAALGGAPTYFGLYAPGDRPWTWWGADKY